MSGDLRQQGRVRPVGGVRPLPGIDAGLAAQDAATIDGGLHRGQEVARATEPIAGVVKMMRLKAARTAMKLKWMDLGGPDSQLGLPMSQSFPITQADGSITMNFRGGTLHVLSDGDAIVAPEQITMDANYRVAISFEGMGLEIRQEHDGDELYGSLSLTDGGRRRIEDFTIPQVTLGPESNHRIYKTSMELFHDRPPSDISIAIKLFEHDEGDRDAMRAEIRKRVHQVFDKAVEEVGDAVPGPVGAAAAAMSRETGVDNSLTHWAVTALADGIDAFLGLGDDQYNGTILTIPYEEQLHIPPLQTYRCSHDPQTIDYTHKVTVNSRDDGHDLGQVSLLFKVRSAL
ncbi:MAG: hypothetical protein JF567_09285 [Xanthomonadales bacterium]|nr:hypothetical protein [Xanthomonadales bacterium]